jgi:hypothetical protein
VEAVAACQLGFMILREGEAVEDGVLQRLVSAVEELRRQAAEAKTDADYWLGVARAMSKELGGRNKLAAAIGVSGPYLGRVLRGVKPVTAELIVKLCAFRGKNA